MKRGATLNACIIMYNTVRNNRQPSETMGSQPQMPATEQYRIFVGAFPQGEAADRIQAIRTAYDPVTDRITAPHVTVAGTYWRNGPATPEQEAETIAKLQSVQATLQPFVLQLGGIAHFPPLARPVVYLQVANTPALLAIRAVLLQVLGRDKHRQFTPHLTLAMRLKGAAAQQMLDALQQSTWHTERWDVPIHQLSLMQRGPHDPAWRVIATIPMQATSN